MKIRKAIVILISIVSLFASAEENERHSKRDFVPYRGMRMTTEQTEFTVRSLIVQNNSNGENSLMEITVRFSMPIDPRSVTGETVLLNGSKCGSNVFFHFGRRGESVRITIVNPEEEKYTLKFEGIKSYKEDVLKENIFENIQDGTEIIKGRQ